MTRKSIKILNLSILLLAAPGAWAETINCTPITSLPEVIDVQGIYCFTGNLATSMASGNAIYIQANNVTIDLNGWKLGNLAAGAGTGANGIIAVQRKNITIRNGTIRGFNRGISLIGISPYTISQGHLVEDIRADRNTYIGIEVMGRGNIVRRNQVLDTGGATGTDSARGMILMGSGGRALNNNISSTTATSTGTAIGLHLMEANGAVVEGNRIDGVSSGTGNTYGLHIENSNDVLIRANSIISAKFGIWFNASNSGGKYMGTLISNVTTPYQGGGTAVGDNTLP